MQDKIEKVNAMVDSVNAQVEALDSKLDLVLKSIAWSRLSIVFRGDGNNDTNKGGGDVQGADDSNDEEQFRS